jgi:hypothetical protein
MRSAALAALVLAGCLGPAAPPDAATPAPLAWAFRGDEPAVLATSARVTASDLGYWAAEPTMAAVAGGVFVSAIDCDPLPDPAGCRPHPVVLRREPGPGWAESGPRLLGHDQPVHTTDPLLVGDPASGLLFFVNGLQPCASLWRSSDAGATWQEAPLPCGTPGPNDHPTLAVVPPRTSGAAHPAVLLCFNQVAFAACTRSTDGGTTWDLQRPVPPAAEGLRPCTHLTGHLHARAGRAFLPTVDCTVDPPRPRIHASDDLGLTWTALRPPEGFPLLPGFHDVAVAGGDREGPLHTTWVAADGRLVHSAVDAAGSWTAPRAVSPPFVTAAWYNALAELDGGRLAVAYLGSTWPGGYGSPELRAAPSPDAPNGAVWHLYLTVFSPAEDPLPAETFQLTAPSSPVARGLCGQTQCVPLGDFIGVAVEGARVWVPVVDGCRDTCRDDATRGMSSLDGMAFAVDLVQGPP